MATKPQIRKIQTLKHQVAWLCKDRSAWEGFLTSCAGRLVTSSTELSLQEGARVIEELRRHTRETSSYPARYGKRPSNMDDTDRGPLLKKIEACLAELHRLTGAAKSWAYVDSIAKRSFRVDKIQFCRGWQLHKIVAMLEEHILKLKDRQETHAPSLHQEHARNHQVV